MALPQVPRTWLTTNACALGELSSYGPPALQLPAEAHDTEKISATPPLLRAARPGTCLALPQVPCTSLTTNAVSILEGPVPFWYHPPALQLPAEAHDTESISPIPPCSRAARPGTCL